MTIRQPILTLCVTTETDQGGPYFYYYPVETWDNVRRFVDNIHHRIGARVLSVKGYALAKDEPGFASAEAIQTWTAEEFIQVTHGP